MATGPTDGEDILLHKGHCDSSTPHVAVRKTSDFALRIVNLKQNLGFREFHHPPKEGDSLYTHPETLSVDAGCPYMNY